MDKSIINLLLDDWEYFVSSRQDYVNTIDILTNGRGSISCLVLAIIKKTKEIQDVEMQLESYGIKKENIAREAVLYKKKEECNEAKEIQGK